MQPPAQQQGDAFTAPLSLAFYNGRDFGTRLDRLVAAHDRGASAGPFSHAELVFNHRVGHTGRACLCFSSSWRDGGVRFKRIDLDAVPRKWSAIPVSNVSKTDVQVIRAFCVDHLGGRYDLPGVLAFKLPLVRHRLNWWFCSEICVAALQKVGLFMGISPHEISPNALHRLARLHERLSSSKFTPPVHV